MRRIFWPITVLFLTGCYQSTGSSGDSGFGGDAEVDLSEDHAAQMDAGTAILTDANIQGDTDAHTDTDETTPCVRGDGERMSQQDVENAIRDEFPCFAGKVTVDWQAYLEKVSPAKVATPNGMVETERLFSICNDEFTEQVAQFLRDEGYTCSSGAELRISSGIESELTRISWLLLRRCPLDDASLRFDISFDEKGEFFSVSDIPMGRFSSPESSPEFIRCASEVLSGEIFPCSANRKICCYYPYSIFGGGTLGR